MGLTFVAIDFETANAHRGSPCALGLAEFVDGELRETRSLLMRPPAEYDYFEGINSSIHGITAEKVAGQPRFRDLWPEVQAFINDRVVVAHNAAFDISVITNAASVSEMPWPSLKYACTMVQARQAYDLISYTLPSVAEAAGVTLQNHHDAGADSTAAGEIMVAIAKHFEVDTFEDLGRATHTRLGILREGTRRGNERTVSNTHRSGSRLSMPEVNSDADPLNPLFGKRVVFTGPLGSMTRQQAVELCAELGAETQQGMRKDTDLLVVGIGTDFSSKLQKALNLKKTGSSLEIMSAEDFLDMAYEALEASASNV